MGAHSSALEGREDSRMAHEHPGSFFGITEYGSDQYLQDNALNIFNSTLNIDRWRDAFKKCDYDNSDSIERQLLPDVVRHLYWGRVPPAAELDFFMLHFDSNKPDKISWAEFAEGVNNFRQAEVPEGMGRTVREFTSGEKYRDALRKHTRLEAAPKQTLARPVTTHQELGFLAEECLAMNGSSNTKFRRQWTDIAQYGDCVDRNNQGRTIASEMSPSMKKTLHEAQGSSIMLL